MFNKYCYKVFKSYMSIVLFRNEASKRNKIANNIIFLQGMQSVSVKGVICMTCIPYKIIRIRVIFKPMCFLCSEGILVLNNIFIFTKVVRKHTKNRRGEVEDKIIYKDAYRS